MVGHGGDRTIPIKAATTTSGLPIADVIFVQCKATHSEPAVAAAKNIVGNETVLISFQNGLGNEELLASIVGADKVLGGLTAQSASIEAPGVVRNYAELPSYIGEMTGDASARTADLAALFTEHGLPTTPSADIPGNAGTVYLFLGISAVPAYAPSSGV